MSRGAITVLPPGRVTREEFYAWSERQTHGRFERIDGAVVAMAPERVGHALVKAGIWLALRQAVSASGHPCRALPDGVTVRIDENTDYEPDALVDCSGVIDRTLVYAPTPVIVVEVASSSTRAKDAGIKLIDYFRVSSIQHYLLVYEERAAIVHHRRAGDAIATAILSAGTLVLDPPGLVVDTSLFFAE